jgi:hypothetical protein
MAFYGAFSARVLRRSPIRTKLVFGELLDRALDAFELSARIDQHPPNFARSAERPSLTGVIILRLLALGAVFTVPAFAQAPNTRQDAQTSRQGWSSRVHVYAIVLPAGAPGPAGPAGNPGPVGLQGSKATEPSPNCPQK